MKKSDIKTSDVSKSLDDRLATLDEKLETREKIEEAKKQKPKSDMSGFGAGLKLSSEFISAILVGAGIGYLIDRLVGTLPWGMIFFLLLGFAAGVVNVMRAAGKMSDPYQSGPSMPRHKKDSQHQKGQDDLYDDDED
ncbi:MAG: ATP F0F1 synthase subunit I [Hyphomicrobiales bacterium]|nr:AtpZ/AtpI family protein [Hyphomicrobiales bacterium]PCH50020.1 MAG: ATP F0F1 synthase subunit I [Hyphomicrobiales bacterium]